MLHHWCSPEGTSTRIANVEAYIAKPGANAHQNVAILYLPDVIGIWQNSKLIADQYAANGYYTLLLDILNGDPVPLNRPAEYDISVWRTQGNDGKTPHTVEAVEPIVKEAIAHLRDTLGVKRIGVVGYCFGAKYVARSLAAGQGCDVGYVAHPSFVDEAELRAMKGPFAISAAEVDEIFPAEKRHRSEEILADIRIPYQINLFSGVEHGFATRCDLTNRQERFAKEQAFVQAVTWFDQWLLD